MTNSSISTDAVGFALGAFARRRELRLEYNSAWDKRLRHDGNDRSTRADTSVRRRLRQGIGRNTSRPDTDEYFDGDTNQYSDSNPYGSAHDHRHSYIWQRDRSTDPAFCFKCIDKRSGLAERFDNDRFSWRHLFA